MALFRRADPCFSVVRPVSSSSSPTEDEKILDKTTHVCLFLHWVQSPNRGASKSIEGVLLLGGKCAALIGVLDGTARMKTRVISSYS